jgi:pimeloyl-ACP methyl ester carboxylesterase
VETVLLLHAGVADRRMWRPQVETLEAAGFRVLAPDLRGFGDRRLEPVPFSHRRDVEALLEAPSAIVGSSLGGRVALELALDRPDLVERLVLIAPGLPGWDWSEETRARWAEEEAAVDRGDDETAAEISLRLWVDGPHRSPHEVDPGVRSSAREMALRSYEMQRDGAAAGAREDGVLDVDARLGQIRCPTLILVGDLDVPEMQAIAAHVADSVSGALLVTVHGAAHLPSLERPDTVDPLLLAFLGEP